MEKAHRNPAPQTSESAQQAGLLQMDGVTMAVLGIGALIAIRGYLWVQSGEIWKAALLGAGNSPRTGRGRLDMAPVEEVPQQDIRPFADTGEGGTDGLRRRGAGHRHTARGHPVRRGPGACWARWRRPTATTTTRRGPRFRVGKDARPGNIGPAGCCIPRVPACSATGAFIGVT